MLEFQLLGELPHRFSQWNVIVEIISMAQSKSTPKQNWESAERLENWWSRRSSPDLLFHKDEVHFLYVWNSQVLHKILTTVTLDQKFNPEWRCSLGISMCSALPALVSSVQSCVGCQQVHLIYEWPEADQRRLVFVSLWRKCFEKSALTVKKTKKPQNNQGLCILLEGSVY